MKAIVLTYDKQIGFAELIHKIYMDKWKDCPLTFRIPWNDSKPQYFDGKKNVELINCGSSIRDTMFALLGDIPCDEFVYWCIDDRFPKKILDPYELTKLHDYLSDPNVQLDFDAVKLFAWFGKPSVHGKNKDEALANGLKYRLLEKLYDVQVLNHKYGYYFHYFCRSKYLKHHFLI